MSSLKKFYRKMLPDMALFFAMCTATNILSKKTVRSTLGSEVRRIFTGSRELPHEKVPAIEDLADTIKRTTNEKSILPKLIGIDGPPGSGKSSLGRALAERYSLQWQTLYWKEISGRYPFNQGKIYENMRLVRTQDVEQFDIVIYIDCPIEEAKSRVITRNRTATLADVVDFARLKKIGDAAFEMLEGDEIHIAQSPIRMKLKPQNGYKDMANLTGRLRQKGIDATGYSKEELLFIYCYGKPRKGVSPYVKLGAYNKEIFSGIYQGLVVALVKRYLS